MPNNIGAALPVLLLTVVEALDPACVGFSFEQYLHHLVR
jgi:hypothetical protein